MSEPVGPAQGTLLVLGLGNPGPRYQATRHNLGFMVVDELAGRMGIALGKKSHHSLWGQGLGGGRKVILAQPQTYMNNSGQAALDIMSYFELPPQRVVVVHDDLDLEPGRLKLAARGGAGGHKGVASLLAHLHSDQFLRLRVGIGRPRYQEAIEDYVLAGCYADQRQLFAEAVMQAADCLELVLTQGATAAMQRFNTRG